MLHNIFCGSISVDNNESVSDIIVMKISDVDFRLVSNSIEDGEEEDEDDDDEDDEDEDDDEDGGIGGGGGGDDDSGGGTLDSIVVAVGYNNTGGAITAGVLVELLVFAADVEYTTLSVTLGGFKFFIASFNSVNLLGLFSILDTWLSFSFIDSFNVFDDVFDDVLDDVFVLNNWSL